MSSEVILAITERVAMHCVYLNISNINIVENVLSSRLDGLRNSGLWIFWQSRILGKRTAKFISELKIAVFSISWEFQTYQNDSGMQVVHSTRWYVVVLIWTF